jgi:hypothetical protein
LIPRRRRGRERRGKAGDRLRPTPPGSSATRFVVCLPAGRIPRKDHRGRLGCVRKREDEGARSTGIASSCGVPGEAKAACERSGGVRVERRAMEARGPVPVGDEPADLLDEGSEPGLVRWEAGRLNRLCEGPRSVRKGGPRCGSADPRTLDDGATGWQFQARRRSHETLPRCANGGARPFREEDRARSRNPNCGLRVHTSSGAIQLRSSPEVSISVEAATSSGTVVTRRL